MSPNTVWVADITYIRLQCCFVYLATLLDSFSRVCVGWSLSPCIDTRLTLDALEQALAWRQMQPEWIHHSDRGVQYASNAYVQRLAQAGAHVSMAAKGNPYENAQAESFFKTLKSEEVYLKEYEGFEDAQANLQRFIEKVYTPNSSIPVSAIYRVWNLKPPNKHTGYDHFNGGLVFRL